MSDPLERLRGGSFDDEAPPADVIRSRARRIERRRYAAIGGGATVVAVIAAVGIFVSGGPSRPVRDLAKSAPETLSDSAVTEGSGGSAGQERTKGRVARPETTASAESELTPAGVAGSTAADRAGSELTLSLSVKDRAVGRGADLTLKACNDSGETVSRSFSSGQRYDFEVTQDGERVWQWSIDRAFTQELGSESWGPGKCKSWEAAWDGMDNEGAARPPGEYEAVGVLTSSTPQKTEPEKFCLDLC